MFCRDFAGSLTVLCPLRTSLYQPGGSTVAVKPLAQSRMTDLLQYELGTVNSAGFAVVPRHE
jgi:hypothetical protein